ncbi:MAG: LytTR family transcriptional regulator DNA-binding domain-containing protein [Bacteroidota bacterium]
MNKFLKQKYPSPAGGSEGFLISLGIGLFIAFFLWFFQPFDINIRNYSDGEVLFFGVISFCVFFFGHSLLPLLIPTIYEEEKWTLSKQIIFYLCIVFVIASLNGLYINYLRDLSFSWGNYRIIILQTTALGIIVISMYVLLSFYWKNSRMIQKAESLNEQLKVEQEAVGLDSFRVSTQIKGESFEIKEDSFLFAKSDGNYIEVFESGQKSKLYRMNLSELEMQLSGSDYFLRCHRSFLVNATYILKVSGNAQGLKLGLKDGKSSVPVSRKYIASIKAYLERV